MARGGGIGNHQPPAEPFPGVRRSVIDGDRATLVRYIFAARAGFPLHAHPEEQITLVEDGSIEFTVGDEKHPLRAGDWLVVEGGVDRGATAGPEGARVLGVTAPRRATRDAYISPPGSRRRSARTPFRYRLYTLQMLVANTTRGGV